MVFRVGTSAYTATNDSGSIRVNSISLTHNGDFTPDLWLTGGTIAFESDGGEKPQLAASNRNASIRIGSDLVLAADLTLSRPSLESFGFLFIGSGIDGGNVNLGSHTLLVTRPYYSAPNASDRIRIGEPNSTTRGVIGGTGRIVLQDPSIPSFPAGELTLQLGSRNTYSGGTEVKHNGQLALNGDTLVQAGIVQSGPVGTGPVIMSGGTLRSNVTRRTLHNEVVARDYFDLGAEGFAGIVVAGPIRLEGNYGITVQANTLGTEEGVVEVSGPISEVTPGTSLSWQLFQPLKLTSICTYTGSTDVTYNTLHLNAPGSLRNSPLTLGYQAGLSGDGETGQVVVHNGAVVRPGAGVGILHSFGNVNLQPGARLSLEISTPIAGIGYDQWDVHGEVSLQGANLDLLLTFDPSDFADVFFLLTNDGLDAVSGIFTSLNGSPGMLSEGAHFVVANQEFEISYTAEQGVGFAGTGNDIAIRALPEPSTTVILALCGAVLLCRRGRPSRPIYSG